MKKEYYTVQEVADLIGFHRGSIYRLIKKGELKQVKIGRSVRIKHSDLEYLLQQQREKTS